MGSPVELPHNLFSTETVREVEQVASWVMPLVAAVSSGGTAAAIIGGIKLLSWLRSKKKPAEAEAPKDAPFPRALDEARQLLAIRQSEGRVAVLDALRGMFLDDELAKLQESEDPETKLIATRLHAAIDARVDEVAPLSTSGE